MSEAPHDADAPAGTTAPSDDALIAVAVVDENDIFRRGLVACLIADAVIDVTFESAIGPVPDGTDVVVASRSAAVRLRPAVPVIICSDQPRSLRSATGREVAVLPRASLTERQLVAAVRAAASGLRVGAPHPEAARPFAGEISPRSIETLRLLAAGCGTREISAAVGYSERTVKAVIASIQRRLGARTRAQLVAQAIREGWI